MPVESLALFPGDDVFVPVDFVTHRRTWLLGRQGVCDSKPTIIRCTASRRQPMF
jgi:hypothetical protein